MAGSKIDGFRLGIYVFEDAEGRSVIWVAAEMRAGGAFAHSTVALHALDDERR